MGSKSPGKVERTQRPTGGYRGLLGNFKGCPGWNGLRVGGSDEASISAGETENDVDQNLLGCPGSFRHGWQCP